MAKKKKAVKQSKKLTRKAAPKKAAARKPAPRAARPPPSPKWKQPGRQDVLPSLVLRDAAAALEFYKAAFGAEVLARHDFPGGKGIMHAEIRIGDTVIAMNDEMPGAPGWLAAAGPNHKPTSSFLLYTKDCDALAARAVQAGAQLGMPVADMFWGDRMGAVTDPFGQVWMIATHKKDLSEDELIRAGEEAMKQMAQQQQQHAPPQA